MMTTITSSPRHEETGLLARTSPSNSTPLRSSQRLRPTTTNGGGGVLTRAESGPVAVVGHSRLESGPDDSDTQRRRRQQQHRRIASSGERVRRSDEFPNSGDSPPAASSRAARSVAAPPPSRAGGGGAASGGGVVSASASSSTHARVSSSVFSPPVAAFAAAGGPAVVLDPIEQRGIAKRKRKEYARDPRYADVRRVIEELNMAVGEERERTERRMDEWGGDNELLRFECLFCSRFPYIL